MLKVYGDFCVSIYIRIITWMYVIHLPIISKGVHLHWSQSYQWNGAEEEIWIYRERYNISHTLVGAEIFDHSDAVWASHIGAALTTSSFST